MLSVLIHFPVPPYPPPHAHGMPNRMEGASNTAVPGAAPSLRKARPSVRNHAHPGALCVAYARFSVTRPVSCVCQRPRALTVRSTGATPPRGSAPVECRLAPAGCHGLFCARFDWFCARFFLPRFFTCAMMETVIPPRRTSVNQSAAWPRPDKIHEGSGPVDRRAEIHRPIASGAVCHAPAVCVRLCRLHDLL